MLDNLPQQLQRKIKVGPDCWEWTASLGSGGYGQITYQMKHWKAHRLVWTLEVGLIEDGLCVLHKCDNPICVRLDHLFLGTHQENMKDMQRKGRSRKGPWRHSENHPMAKLTDARVREIRELLKEGVMGVRIAERFNVSPSVISNIRSGRKWAHVK